MEDIMLAQVGHLYVLKSGGIAWFTSEDLMAAGALVSLGLMVLAVEALRGWFEDRRGRLD
jgi:hypothetical protein